MKDNDEILREMIRHEDGLISSRMGWMSAFQGLLFGALGLSISSNNPPLILFVSILGFLVAIFTVYGVRLALAAISRLVKCHGNDTEECPGVIGLKKSIPNFLMPWLLIPCLFAFAWLVIGSSTILYALDNNKPINPFYIISASMEKTKINS